MTEMPNGFCTCYPNGRPAPDCGVAAHRQEARDNDFADMVRALSLLQATDEEDQ